jgi:DNA-binding transcriptional LysR family regulator
MNQVFMGSIPRPDGPVINDEKRYVPQARSVDRSPMELRQLEYALAVAQELHFGRAAERMHVTQQSVSEQVRRLERELGAPLFARTSRSVSVTTVGEAFLPEARRVVDGARHALEVGRHSAQGYGGELRVGYAEDIGPRLFQFVVPRLAERGPAIRVVPQPMTTAEQLVALREHRLDLAFGWDPQVTSDLDSLLVAREPLVVALGEHHPLAGDAAVDPARLSGQPLVLLPRDVNPHHHDHVTGQLKDLGVVVTVEQHVSGLDRMIPLVLAGSAVAITVPSAASAKPSPGVVYRYFTDPSPEASYSLVWLRGTTSSATLGLVEVVRALRDDGAFLPPDLPG